MANVYRFLYNVFEGVDSYRIYTSSGISEGDMMQWDATARYATPMTTTSGAIFLGVSEEANPLVGLGTTTNPLTGGRCRIRSQGVHRFATTTGETYSHADPVYMGANAQTVTLLGASNLVGSLHLPDGSQVTGATSATVQVRIFGSMTNVGVAPSSATSAR